MAVSQRNRLGKAYHKRKYRSVNLDCMNAGIPFRVLNWPSIHGTKNTAIDLFRHSCNISLDFCNFCASRGSVNTLNGFQLSIRYEKVYKMPVNSIIQLHSILTSQHYNNSKCLKSG